GSIRVAAIGKTTVLALWDYHVNADVVPKVYRSEALADALRDRVRGQRVLLARADRGREVLQRELATVAEVEQIAVYSQADVAGLDPELLGRLKRGDMDYITLTSANSARTFF